MQGVDVCEPDQHAGVDQGVGEGQREGGVAVGAQGHGAQVGAAADADPGKHQVREHRWPARAAPGISGITVSGLSGVMIIDALG